MQDCLVDNKIILLSLISDLPGKGKQITIKKGGNHYIS